MIMHYLEGPDPDFDGLSTEYVTLQHSTNCVFHGAT